MSFFAECRARTLETVQRDPGVTGFALCEAHTVAVDRLVLDALKGALTSALSTGVDAERPTLPAGWALMAIGGYGRSQMSLRSDVDIQLLIPPSVADPEPFVRALLAPIMTARLRLGHGVRTFEEARHLTQEDVSFATSLLSARHLAGDPLLTEVLRGQAWEWLRGGGRQVLVRDLAEERARRLSRLGDTVFVLEPDLKRGSGGLRDAQLVAWLSQLAGEHLPRPLIFAEDVILKARMLLHAVASYKGDRLAFEYQDSVAGHLGITARDGLEPSVVLLQRVHLASRVLEQHATRRLALEHSRLKGAARQSLPPGGPAGFARVGDHVARADGTVPHHVADIASTARAVAATDLPLEPRAEDALELLARQFDDALASDEGLGELLLELLVEPGPGAQRALRLLHRTGLLARILPEFARITGRVQRDLYHAYTVDEHTLRVVGRLKALARRDHARAFPLATEVMAGLGDRRALMVSALLHDVGKGSGGPHHQRGAVIADRVAERLGLDPSQRRVMRLLIRHQSDMALICGRRDLSDPRPLRSLARMVGTQEVLDQLYLLTLADWSSVGPNAFGSWQLMMLDTLFSRTSEELARGDEYADPLGLTQARRSALQARLGLEPQLPGRDPIDDFCGSLPTHYFSAVEADASARHFELYQRCEAEGAQRVVSVTPLESLGLAEVVVIGESRQGLLADAAGSLAGAGASVVSAEIYSLGDGRVLDIFRITDPEGRLSDPQRRQRLEQATVAALADPDAIHPKLEERRSERALMDVSGLPPVPTTVSGSNRVASRHSVFDVTTADRVGLLHDIAHFFRARGLSVEQARVATEGRVARDSFYVVSATGEKLSAEALDETARALTEALAA